MANLYKQICESLALDDIDDVSINYRHKRISVGNDIYNYYAKRLSDNNISMEETEECYNFLIKSDPGTYIVNDYAELKNIIIACLAVTYKPDLNWIDVHKITSMKYLFSPYYDSNMTFIYIPDSDLENFNGDISKWDTSHVVDMSYMFRGCKEFNQPIYLNTHNVKDMSYMFYGCEQFD